MLQTSRGDITVLMSVYAGTEAPDLAAALDSLWAQTHPAEQVLVVEDGPLSAELRDLLASQRAQRTRLRTLSLPRNRGLGPALQAGLGSVTTEFLARLDSDDVAAPERLERQRRYLLDNPGVSVLGTAVQEFDDEGFRLTDDLERVLGKRRVLPETHQELARYARINSPLNHPSVMARTAAVRGVGGYRDVHHMEDYDLWARLIVAGHRLHNLPEPLTYFRTSPAQFQRRTGRGMFAAERQMQRNLVAYGLVSRPRSWVNLTVRTAYRLLPTGLLTAAYGRLFHR